MNLQPFHLFSLVLASYTFNHRCFLQLKIVLQITNIDGAERRVVLTEITAQIDAYFSQKKICWTDKSESEVYSISVMAMALYLLIA